MSKNPLFTKDEELRLWALRVAAETERDRIRFRKEDDDPAEVRRLVLDDAKTYYAWLTEDDDRHE
jgi:hypothetical protein